MGGKNPSSGLRRALEAGGWRRRQTRRPGSRCRGSKPCCRTRCCQWAGSWRFWRPAGKQKKIEVQLKLFLSPYLDYRVNTNYKLRNLLFVFIRQPDPWYGRGKDHSTRYLWSLAKLSSKMPTLTDFGLFKSQLVINEEMVRFLTSCLLISCRGTYFGGPLRQTVATYWSLFYFQVAQQCISMKNRRVPILEEKQWLKPLTIG